MSKIFTFEEIEEINYIKDLIDLIDLTFQKIREK